MEELDIVLRSINVDTRVINDMTDEGVYTLVRVVSELAKVRKELHDMIDSYKELKEKYMRANK